MSKIFNPSILCIIIVSLFLTLTSTSWQALAMQSQVISGVEEKAINLQNTYSQLISLEFDFTQITRTGGRERHGAGDAIFYRSTNSKNIKRSSVMRWNYQIPDEQIITNNGEKIAIYTKKDQQMLITPASELESDITYAFLSGSKQLLDDFTTGEPDTRFSFSITGINISSLQLIPKQPHSQVKAIHVWFDETFTIHKIIIEDHFDSVTELHFTNIQLNKLPKNNASKILEITHIQIPPGTEIISQ